MMTVEINTPPLEEEKRKIRKVKLSKASRVGKGEPDEYALKLIENEIKKYVAGVSYELINEYIRIGHEIRTKYEDLAYSEGFNDVSSFIEHVVDFYLSWKDKLPKLLEELDKLKTENTLLKTVSSKEFRRLIRANLYKELMMYSLAFNVRRDLVEFWKEQIEALLNDEREGETNTLSISNLGDITREHNESDRADSRSRTKNKSK